MSQPSIHRQLVAAGAGLILALQVIAIGSCVFAPDPDYEGREWTIEEIKTADGFVIKARHYANPHGVPVILQHGLSGNHNHWDLPLPGDSLARYLAARGYDVWVTTNRGQGFGEMKSPAPLTWRWNADDLAIYDIPAIVDAVTERTGQEPFYLGHSMGGATMLMYLQGITYDDNGRVVSDPALVEKRNAGLRGVVDVAGPVALPEVEAAGGKSCWVTYPATCAYWSICWAPRLPVNWIRSLNCVGCGWLAGTCLNPAVEPGNLTCRQSAALARYGADDISPPIYGQMLATMKDGKFKEDCDGCADPYVYSANLDKVIAPILIIGGIPDTVRVEWMKGTFDRIGSLDKDYLEVPHGHVDELFGITTKDDVYKPILDWLEKRK